MIQDTRSFHVKVGPTIAGKTHFITILPPSEQKHDETVWRFRKHHEGVGQEERGMFADYVMTQADQFA